jgi:HEAT repeat protein
MNGLAGAQTPESAAYLADMLARGDSFERMNAAILIGHQDLEIAMPALIRALGDGEERVRNNALETLRGRSRGRDFGSDAGAWSAWWQSRPR